MKARHLDLLLGATVVASALLGVGCYPKAGPAPGALSANSVTWASSHWPGTTAESLNAGHDAFIAKCNGCHSYPDLTAIDDDKWPSIIKSMGHKADLDASKSDDVLHYILATRHP